MTFAIPPRRALRGDFVEVGEGVGVRYVFPSFSLFLSFALFFSLSLSLTHTLMLTLPHTQTHTHTHTHHTPQAWVVWCVDGR